MSQKRQSNRPDRRIAPVDSVSQADLQSIEAAARYGGTPYHKCQPGDYGFHPPSDPRPSKGLCDDLRPILKDEAARLLSAGIRKGMVSRPKPGQLPKYIWAVDEQGEPYEAKTDPGQGAPYHGYRLSDKDPQMRAEVLKEWFRR
jgi:hypothetical protein